MPLPAEVSITDSILRLVDPPQELVDGLVSAGISSFTVAGVRPMQPGFIPVVTDLEAVELAVSGGYERLGLVAAASDEFAERHLDGSVDELMHRIRRVLLDGPLEIRYRTYVETVTHCPYEGEQDADWVAHLAATLVEWGADEVVLVESSGQATPFEIERLLFEVQESVEANALGMMLGDAYGMGLANTMSALEAGVARFESTAGGVGGGCATEDLAHLLRGLDIESGIDPIRVARAMVGFCEQQGVDYKSRAGRALLDAEGEK